MTKMRLKIIGACTSLGMMLGTLGSSAQSLIPLYGKNIPGAISTKNEETIQQHPDLGAIHFNTTEPTLAVFLPDPKLANGTAAIICPGGGYGAVAIDFEGVKTAKMLNAWGVTAFILKYRLPSDKSMKDKSTGPLQDLQQAIKRVKNGAQQWKIDTTKVGVFGFSAGGHLAASGGVHFNHPVVKNPKVSLRPAFMVLVYPVISMLDSFGHLGSRNNLLGANPDASTKTYFSNETQVGPQTPPTLLLHTQDDKVVPVANSLAFFDALSKNKVPAEMHIFPTGDHGFFGSPTLKDEWPLLVKNWMQRNGWLKR